MNQPSAEYIYQRAYNILRERHWNLFNRECDSNTREFAYEHLTNMLHYCYNTNPIATKNAIISYSQLIAYIKVKRS